MGAAGSGKTVLLKTALGLVRPDSGRVFAFGKDLTTLRERDLFEVRSKVGMLFQESALFDSLTIEENVAYPLLNQKSIHYPKQQVHQRVEEALEFVELEGTLEKFPSELSGGMRRRAAIARAVVTDPPLVLYDSPTAGLDPDHRAHHHGADRQGAGYQQHHHPDGDAPLPGRESGGEFSLQFQTRGSGSGA